METVGTPEYYLETLSVSLEQKEKVLQELTALTEQQERVLAVDTLDMDAFEELLRKKQKQREKLQKLDAGFEQIYQRVREELQGHPGQYKEVVLGLQKQISKLTDMGVLLEVQERRNKERLESVLAVSRSKIRNYKVSNQAASQYYKNMANRHQGESYFVDKKK